MEDKEEKVIEIKENNEKNESKDNIETKEESENEIEQKEDNIIKNETKVDNQEIIISKKEENENNQEIKNDIINEEKEKIQIIKEKKESEKELKEEEDKKNLEDNNNNIIITNIKKEENEKEDEENNSELKDILFNEKSLDQLNENEQLFNNEEKENSDEDEPEYSKNDIERLYLRTKSNKSMKIEQFYEQKRHYFIMTEGGTPIYSRYGDEIKNCSLLATFSAIITKFTIFNNEKNSQEKLNYICNDNSIIAFLKKGKIVFIALSNKTDSLSFLYSQLELLYHQLLSIVTSERMPILEEKPSSCSTVLSGINESLEQIIEYSNNTLVGLLSSYQVLPIENRQKLNNICHKYLKNALICCLITPDAKEIISLSKSNIINFIFQ